MFIKDLIYNYNAQELLLTASRLVFALYAWVALILIMELIVVLLLVGKKKNTQHKRFQPIVLGLHDCTSTRSTIDYDTTFLSLLAPFLTQKPTIEHRLSYNSHFLYLLQYHFWPFPSRQDRL
jgi:hypothetical protein